MARWPYNTSAWLRLRAAKLAAEPLCKACQMRGNVTLANAVDHIVAIAKGGATFPALDGLMSLCERCHNEKTRAVDAGTNNATGRKFKGFDGDGNPIDSGDRWYGGGVDDHEKPADLGPMGEMSSYLVSTPYDDDGDEGGFA